MMKISFYSIQTKFSILTMIAILLSAGVVGGSGLYHMTRAVDKSTARIINAVCQAEGATLDALFLRIEQSVNIMAYKALEEKDIVSVFQDPQKREAYLAEMETVLLGAAGSTRGAVAAYLRFDPRITSHSSGLFYSKSNWYGNIQEQKEGKFFRHYIGEHTNPDWYTLPIEKGEAVWLTPYNNGKLKEPVISYAMPLYEDDQLVGVVGMDVLFEDVIQEINKIQVYDTGYAYLLDASHKMVYHPQGEEACPIQHNLNAWEIFVEKLEKNEGRDHIFNYEHEGQSRKMTYCNLENGMRLVVTAPIKETDIEKRELAESMGVLSVGITIFCIVITLTYTRTIIKPLKELTHAAKQVAEGDMDVTLLNQSRDEVGELSTSFQQTVDCLKVYMERMNELAYRDPLTGVKSKTAYDEETRKVNNGLQMGFDEFGVLMMDINNLKQVNDHYGHESGNAYIINCCRLICNCFKHSPVFRIGGDEFIVLLVGDDLKEVQVLLERFEARMKEINDRAENPEERISVAAGLAIYDEKRDRCYEDVFKRADEAMYEQKAAMKKREKG